MRQRIEDKDGVWELNENGVTWDLIEPSQEFIDEQNKPPLDNPIEPTQEEINVEFDYRLSLVELGLL